MSLKKDTVVILKSINYSEADKILTVFGRYSGKFTLMAKGIRKMASKNRGNMQTLSVSDISFFEGKGMSILRDSNLIISPNYSDLDMKNVERVLYMLNKLLPESSSEPQIFEGLVKIIRTNFDTDSVNRFRIFLLKELGFTPDYNVCGHCNSRKSLFAMNFKTFEVVCNDCYNELDKKRAHFVLFTDMQGNTLLCNELDAYVKGIIN